MNSRKSIAVIACALFFTLNLGAQKYFSKTGEISFYSQTPMENIAAESNSASTVYDSESGNIQWAVLIKSFEFEKALMQEHFNENYMESSKFPKGVFKGKIQNNEEIDLQKDGNYTAMIEGDLTIHGVTNKINTQAEFKVIGGKIDATTSFKVAVADYGIEIPAVVRENIAKEIEITINAEYAILDR